MRFLLPLAWGWLGLAGPLWALVGAVALPRIYRRRGLDPRLAPHAGVLVGMAAGMPGLVLLALGTPPLDRRRFILLPALAAVAEIGIGLRLAVPDSICIADPGYTLNQLQNGLVLGAVFATVAVGLTLIYSVLGVVSFCHGQFVMLGGVAAYLLLSGPLAVNPVVAVPLVGILALAAGIVVEKALLGPLNRRTVERPDEYAILITFGFGIFLQYALLGLLGPTSGIRAPRYTDRPWFGLDSTSLQFAGLRIDTNLLIAGLIGLALFAALTWFLRSTWWGRALRAVAAHPQAATVAGIDSGRTFTLAFGMGSMLAGMAGAGLVPALTFPIPDIAGQMAIRSYVIVVLGGLGSVPGAFIGGLFIGAVEALGAGCFPDPSKGAIYQPAFGLLIFAAVLLLRPQGLFGRRR